MWSRYGDGVHNAELARLHLALLLTLKGTPFLYNGEEIGMPDLELADARDLRDTAAINLYQTMIGRMGAAPAEALRAAAAATRDRCRSPMQWSGEPNAGFSPPGAQPWLPVDSSYASGVSVAAQADDPGSLLAFYQRVLRLRRSTPALVAGDYQALQTHGDALLAFLRHDPASAALPGGAQFLERAAALIWRSATSLRACCLPARRAHRATCARRAGDRAIRIMIAELT